MDHPDLFRCLFAGLTLRWLPLQSQAEASAQAYQDAPSEQRPVEGPYASLPDMYGHVIF